jgi:DNA-binding transcriptional ArsR family regulator
MADDKQDLIAALNHRTRRQMLRLLHADEEPLSPARMAERLDRSMSSISYHVCVLRGCRAIDLVGEQQVRGAIEHFYVSEVADNPTVLKVLEETEAEDEIADAARSR